MDIVLYCTLFRYTHVIDKIFDYVIHYLRRKKSTCSKQSTLLLPSRLFTLIHSFRISVWAGSGQTRHPSPLRRLPTRMPRRMLHLLYDHGKIYNYNTNSEKPGCPMHASKNASPPPSEPETPSACPVRSKDSPFYVPPKDASASQQPAPESKTSSTLSKLNPLNYMFSSISQERAPNQTVDLPVDRETSSIPRGDTTSGNWEYPSPQQMYNAMLRKGYTDTPQDAVESMVAVHNFLNEGAWAEIVGWERLFSRGLSAGWEKCRRGEENIAIDAAMEEMRGYRSDDDEAGSQTHPPRLLRFQGRPKELTPKARILQTLGWLYPTKFGFVTSSIFSNRILTSQW